MNIPSSKDLVHDEVSAGSLPYSEQLSLNSEQTLPQVYSSGSAYNDSYSSQSRIAPLLLNNHQQSKHAEQQESERQLAPARIIVSKGEAATIIQRAWRRHIDMQVFRYYRDLINFKGQGDPSLMLRCINPAEAKLLDAAAGIHVRFRLAGGKFPPNIYYKIYTHRPIVDMCANSPKDYTASTAKRPTAKQVHTKNMDMNDNSHNEGWYVRQENNGWRLVSDRLICSAMDPVTRESSQQTVNFHHVKIQRKADVEQRRRQRKILWMKKMYKEGMLKAKESDQETSELVAKAARGLVTTVNIQGPDAVMDWEVDELLQWTTALNFDDYLESWKETATSNMSEREAANIKQARSRPEGPGGDPIPFPFDPYALTRASSVGTRQSPARIVPNPSASPLRGLESRPIASHATDASDDHGEQRNVPSEQKYSYDSRFHEGRQAGFVAT